MPHARRAAPARPPLSVRRRAAWGAIAAGLAATAATPAAAGLSVSPLILDFGPGQPSRGDVDVLNTGAERLYVVVEPARIDRPGLPGEHRASEPDPTTLGMLATPGRMILEPGQRKFLRLAVLQPPGDVDHVYRVTVKPVVGGVTGAQTGLKLLVGYDMLVIQRPQAPHGAVSGRREGNALVLTNAGNTNVELFRGQACPAGGAACTDLPSQRLYPGATVRVTVPAQSRVQYTSKTFDKVAIARF